MGAQQERKDMDKVKFSKETSSEVDYFFLFLSLYKPMSLTPVKWP